MGVTFFAPDQTSPGAHPTSYTMGTGSFLGVNWLGHDFIHTSQSCVEVKKNSRTVPELLFCAFMAGYSLKLYHLLSSRVPRVVQLFEEPIEWVNDACYLGMTLDKPLTTLKHTDQVRKKVAQRLGMLGPLLSRRSCLSIRNGVLQYKQFICPMMDYACSVWRFALTPISRNCKGCSPSVFALLPMYPGTLVAGKFKTIWESQVWDHFRSLRE